MWRLNKKIIIENFNKGKTFYFSHNPWSFPNNKFRTKEAEYLIELGATDFVQINSNTWKVIWK